MAKHLNVNLTFNADTNEAKKRIQELQQSLRDVAKLPGGATELFDDASIRKASEAALELERHLSKAVDVDTGKLDLSRFSQSLKASGRDLNSYCDTLLSIGPMGQQAFLKLAQSVATADAPVTRVNAKLRELGTTLMNTARWQISSSILHGFMGALQSAYGYAEDLNKSLNDIRIVTGKTTQDMASFAKHANDAARALSATTTEYTNASLIYFQQGLSEKEVLERTDITVKLAQVTGQSMELTSDQLTAIWNNFYDGSQSLEHYADAVAHLGAITASSSDEIAEGLEKFAAVADMIGLGFDEAAAALATVTANTRQSADVVGTAFKTIFARIQGLNLGETLDDGTTLNKYSAALHAVGINIKDTTGGIKDMNTILNEMGEKWNTLSKDQQIALAQTVAGVRQYSQLVSLMENFDEYQANLTQAQTADGALSEQAETYAEDWEAARARVQAALEGIYDSLLKDDFFIGLLNSLEKIIVTIESVIDSFGGLGGILGSIGGLLMTTFANKMPAILSGLTQNIRTLTGGARKDMLATQAQLDAKLQMTQADTSLPESFRIQAEGIARVNKMKQELVDKSALLTDAEKEEYEARIRNVQAMYKDIDALAKKKEVAQEVFQQAADQVVSTAGAPVTSLAQNYNSLQEQATVHESKLEDLWVTKANADGPDLDNAIAQIEAQEAALEAVRVKAAEAEAQLATMAQAYGLSADEANELVLSDGKLNPKMLGEMKTKVQETATAYQSIVSKQKSLENLSSTVVSQKKAWTAQKKAIEEAAAKMESLGKKKQAMAYIKKETEAMRDRMKAYAQAVQDAAAKHDGLTDTVGNSANKIASKLDNMSMDEMIASFEPLGTEITDVLTNVDEEVLQTTQTMQDMQFDPDAMHEMEVAAEDLATTEMELNNALENAGAQTEEVPTSTFKMSEALMSLGGAAMTTMTAITTITNGIQTLTNPDTSGLEKLGAVVGIVSGAMMALNAITATGTVLKKIDTSADTSNILAKMALGTATKILNLVKAESVGATAAETAAVWANSAAWYANPIMWIALVIIGIVAAVALLVTGIISLTKWLKSMDAGEKLKAAEAEASRAADAFESAEQAANALRESIDKYDSAVEKMKNLAEGTEEYEAALKEANNAARELIENNPDLQGKYTFNVETGLIEFDEGALDDIQTKADSVAQNAQNASIAAQNNVQLAKNNLLIRDAANSDNKEKGKQFAATTFKGTGTGAAIGAGAGAIAGGVTGGVLAGPLGAALVGAVGAVYGAAGGAIVGTITGLTKAIIDNTKVSDSKQEAALRQLAIEFDNSGGNLAVAMQNLSEEDAFLVESLGLETNQLSELITQMSENTAAIRENNKQLVHANFGDTEEFQESSNKEFLAETMGNDIQERADQLYAEEYKDGKGMKDKEAQAAYAAAMGYEVVKNKGGNKAVYKDAEGKEFELDDEVARKYLAQQKAIEEAGKSLTDHADKVEELEDTERALAKAFENGEITYDQYTAAVELAGTKLGFTTDEMERYTQKYGSDVIKRERNEQNLAATVSNRFNVSPDVAEDFVQQITANMTDEELQIALDVAATAQSLDDFQREFQQASTQALLDSFDASKGSVEEMLKTADENKGFSSGDFDALKNDANFTAWLEANNKTMRDLTNATYTEQYNMISQFYSDLETMQQEALETQKDNYQQEMMAYQAVMDFKIAQEEAMSDDAATAKKGEQKMKALEEAWGDTIDFTAYMDLDISEVQDKLSEAADKIQELVNQKYQLDLSWDGIDQLEGSMDELSDFTSMMEEQALKVGDSYKITAAQGKEWMQMYPELFQNAQVTTDGLIELSEADYEAFKESQEGQRQAAIQADIDQIRSRLAELDAEEEAARAELELITAVEQGKLDLDTASAEALANTRAQLTQFYIDSGYDEAEANALALEQMGISQEDYNAKVGEYAQANATNMVNSAAVGAEQTRSLFSKMVERLKGVFTNLGKAIKAIFTGDWSSISGYMTDAWNAAKGEIKAGSSAINTVDVESFTADAIEKYQTTASLELQNNAISKVKEANQATLDQIAASRESLEAQETYLLALQNQGIADYGNTDPTKNVGSAVSESGKRKDRREDDNRYLEIDDKISDLDRKIAKKEKEASELTGEAKIAALKEIEELNALKKVAVDNKLAEATDYLTDDMKAFEQSWAELGYDIAEIQTDENDNVVNIEALYKRINDDYNAKIDAYNQLLTQVESDGIISPEEEAALEAAEQAIEALDERIAAFQDNYSDYVDTRELIEDLREESADLELTGDRERPEDKKHFDQYENRYTDLETAIESVTKATERANREADELYGGARLAKMEQVNASLSAEIGLIYDKIEAAKAFLVIDQAAMEMAFLAAGATAGFEYGSDGAITNLQEVMAEIVAGYDKLIDEYNQMVEAFYRDGMITELEQEQLNQMEQRIEDYETGMNEARDSADRYNSTLALINDSLDSIADKESEIKANNYALLTEALDLALESTTNELSTFDYYLNKIGDDYYAMAEAAVYTNSKLAVSNKVIAAHKNHIVALEAAYASGMITQADYVDGMKSSRDAIQNEMQAILDLDKEMMDYYGNTLTKAEEELTKYTDKISHLSSVLDHYKSLIDAIGMEQDYAAQGIVLHGMADIAENAKEIAKAKYEMMKAEEERKYNLMQSAVKDSEAYEMYKKEWEAASAATSTAQEEMLAATVEWAQSMRAVIENNFAGFAQDLEHALTGGVSFDTLTQQLQHAQSLQENYLTTTNQIYETTKLMRTAQKAIDEATNSIAKQKLKGFIDETAQMQKQTKLSKYELELQQSKYDVLMAELALEDAQNAKSVVRLRQDSEGNFGYVYTADSNAIADAQQKLEDAQNAYYNKGLSGVEDYTSKYIETLQSMYDSLESIQQAYLNGEITTQEEYEQKMEETLQYHYAKLAEYSDLYQIAVSTDSNIVKESWIGDFSSMINKTEIWKTEVNKYIDNCESGFRDWQGVINAVHDEVGSDLDSLAQKVGEISDAGDQLVDEVTEPGGVVDALESELASVSDITEAYALQRAEIMKNIAEMEAYISTISAAIEEMGKYSASLASLQDPSFGGVGSSVSSGGHNGQSSSEEEDDGTLKPGDKIQVKSSATRWASNKILPDYIPGSEFLVHSFDASNNVRISRVDDINAALGTIKLTDIVGFLTGGYTGEWGPEGKMAILHQKELVLNQHDTENLLLAVDTLRSILTAIDMHSLSQQVGGLLSSPGYYNTHNNSVEQNVKIEASFPNVQDHNEIEEAFNNLINRASQYANRK